MSTFDESLLDELPPAFCGEDTCALTEPCDFHNDDLRDEDDEAQDDLVEDEI